MRRDELDSLLARPVLPNDDGFTERLEPHLHAVPCVKRQYLRSLISGLGITGLLIVWLAAAGAPLLENNLGPVFDSASRQLNAYSLQLTGLINESSSAGLLLLLLIPMAVLSLLARN